MNSRTLLMKLELLAFGLLCIYVYSSEISLSYGCFIISEKEPQVCYILEIFFTDSCNIYLFLYYSLYICLYQLCVSISFVSVF